MAEKLSTEQLLQKYHDVMENEAVTAISNWKLPNTDVPTDEEAYVENAKKLGETFFPAVNEVLENL